MLTGAMTVASGAVDHIGGVEPSAEADFQQHDIGRMLREQTKCRRGLDLEDRDRLAVVGLLAMFERGAQFVVVDQHAAAAAAEAIAFVDPHQIGRGVDVDAQAGGFEDRAQIGDGRTLAVGAGDMDHRRQLSFGMIEPRQQRDACDRG